MESQNDYVLTSEANAEIAALRTYHRSQIREFRDAYGLPMSEKPALPSRADLLLHHKLIKEEVRELLDAIHEKDPVEVLDAAGDIVYLCYGLAVQAGYDLDAALDRIHASNMSKLMPDGTVRRRHDGKVLKGPNYQPPVLDDLV